MPHLKLQEAFLCLDCETLGNNPEHCIVCTSKAVHPLASFLNRATRTIAITHELMALVNQVTEKRYGIDMVPDMSEGEHQL